MTKKQVKKIDLQENEFLIRARSPLRISLAGGGTDVPPYSTENGGAVLSTTIDQFAYCTLSSTNAKNIVVESHDYDIQEVYKKISDLKFNGRLDLIKAGLRKINLGKLGFKLTLSVDSPPGSGLGSSSALAVALVGSIIRKNRLTMTSYEIAKLAYDIERIELGIKGGMQDQYASVFGGFNFIEFNKNSVTVNPLRLKNEIINELLASSILCDTTIIRKSGNILNRQIDSYTKKDNSTLEHMQVIKNLTYDMKNSLVKGNILSIGEILNEGWIHKKKIDSAISNKKLNKIYDFAMANGAIGGKLLGAGGGGHFLFFCDPSIKSKLSKELQKLDCNIIKFNFDKYGLQTWLVKNNQVFI